MPHPCFSEPEPTPSRTPMLTCRATQVVRYVHTSIEPCLFRVHTSTVLVLILVLVWTSFDPTKPHPSPPCSRSADERERRDLCLVLLQGTGYISHHDGIEVLWLPSLAPSSAVQPVCYKRFSRGELAPVSTRRICDKPRDGRELKIQRDPVLLLLHTQQGVADWGGGPFQFSTCDVPAGCR
jgi:hypothetical protein